MRNAKIASTAALFTHSNTLVNLIYIWNVQKSRRPWPDSCFRFLAVLSYKVYQSWELDLHFSSPLLTKRIKSLIFFSLKPAAQSPSTKRACSCLFKSISPFLMNRQSSSYPRFCFMESHWESTSPASVRAAPARDQRVTCSRRMSTEHSRVMAGEM